jgi:hypothetical protein
MRAGWSGAEAYVVGPEGPSWHVHILRGPELLHGEGATDEEAWRDALCLVELVSDLRELGRRLRRVSLADLAAE